MTDSIKILVVDDSPDDRLLYQRALLKSGVPCLILEAKDGEQGLRLIQEEDPDCVLLDYSLPGRNGLEILKRIRSCHPFTPVVMLTGQGNETVAVTAIQEGAQNYVSKSTINADTLQRAIRIAIEHCALHRRVHEQRTSLEIFTRALAHDLKEPVRTIRSFIDLLASHEKMSDKGQSYVHYVQNAADRMSTLIDTVYFYTRLEDHEQATQKESCDIAQVVGDVEENLAELIRERHAVITTDTLPSINANRMQMIQVFQNLLANAIRHCEKDPVIHICAEEGANQWLFRISDNGPGINQEYKEKVFEPFKRMSRNKQQGLGLGLAICKKIVESHQGKIWYESRPDSGATFLFTLPKGLSDTQRPAKASSIRREVESHNNNDALGTIMLVEDNEADVELARIMLIEESHLKCNLIVARDGREALDKLQNNGTIDLVLLDINLPGMDGFEFIRRMQADDKLKDVEVVMCTTSTYDKDMEKAKSLGVAGYMTKPAELSKLKPMLEGNHHVQLKRDADGYSLVRAA